MKLTKFNSLPGETSLDKLTAWANGRPVYTQLKYNGVFCRWDKEQKAAFTGNNKRWFLPRFPIALQMALMASPFDVYGELLVPNTHLSEIAGAVSVNSQVDFPAKTYLKVFDVVHPDESWLSQPIAARLQMMQEIDAPDSGLDTASTWLLPADKADAFFKELPKTAEGLVYRRDPCFPVFLETPHPDIVKRKRIHHDEGVCVEVIEGKGKRRGMLGAMVLRLKNGRPLRVGGGTGLTDAVLIDLWNNPPLGKPFTYSYEELSNAGIPLRPQLVTTRDYE